jgi:hypothetical protein
MSFANSEIVLTKDSVVFRLYGFCREYSEGEIVLPETPTDLCTLGRAYGIASTLFLGRILSLLLKGLMYLGLAGCVALYVFSIYEHQGGNGLQAVLKTLLVLVLVAVKIAGILAVAGALLWAWFRWIDVFETWYKKTKMGQKRDTTKPAKKKSIKPVAKKRSGQTSIVRLVSQWLYDKAHGICRPIKIAS